MDPAETNANRNHSLLWYDPSNTPCAPKMWYFYNKRKNTQAFTVGLINSFGHMKAPKILFSKQVHKMLFTHKNKCFKI